ncbi:protocatechuate 3,4-dioxygenase subunit alpha [Micrococcus luteus]
MPWRDGHQLVPAGRADAMRLFGTVYDGNGDPIPDAMIEIWQADAEGVISQEDGSLVQDGFTFTGWGRCAVDNAGRYTFSTVEPGVVNEDRARFIHVVVFARGLLNKLHTRVYLPEDAEAIVQDAFLTSLDEDRRRTLIGTRNDDGSLEFDIWIQGPGEHAPKETVFLQFPGIEYPELD